jgi:hypothetical protein
VDAGHRTSPRPATVARFNLQHAKNESTRQVDINPRENCIAGRLPISPSSGVSFHVPRPASLVVHHIYLCKIPRVTCRALFAIQGRTLPCGLISPRPTSLATSLHIPAHLGVSRACLRASETYISSQLNLSQGHADQDPCLVSIAAATVFVRFE